MLKKAITIILALAMMSGTYQERYHLALSTTKTTTLTMILHVNNSVILYTTW